MAGRSKGNDAALVVLALVGIVVYGLFIVGAWLIQHWLWLLFAGGVALTLWLVIRASGNRKIVATTQQRVERPLSGPEQKAAVILGRHRYNPQAPVGSIEDIAAAVANADWNTARRWLQKIAYRMVAPEVTAEGKAQFTAIMKTFASGDPAYGKLLDRALPTIRAQPGVMQSEFTRGLVGEEVEIVRYMFYFAHELGDIVRVKKGNSYQLYAPGDYDPSKPTVASKPKRRPLAKDVDA